MTVKILSASSGGQWLEQSNTVALDENEKPRIDLAEQETKRILSDVFRCNNLVIVAGLGSTQYLVNPHHPTERLAPTMSDLWAKVSETHNLLGELSWDDLLALVRHPPDNHNLEVLLSQCRLAESFLSGTGLANVQSFIALAEQVIHAAVNFVSEELNLPNHVEFLRRIARRSNRKSRTKVFTTNYDRCFEEAARQGRYVVIDGFSNTTPPTFDAVHFTYDVVRRDRDSELDDFIPNIFHLYKLHGSIDWERHSATGEIRRIPGTKKPLLIYPRYSKYELAFQQPYLEMMASLQSALREQNTGLLVVGFGFSDDHVAEPVLAAIRSNLGLKVAIVSPTLAPRSENGQAVPGDAVDNTHLRKVRTLIGAGDARLALIDSTFENVVPYIPDIAAETDLEKHFERLRRLGA